MSTGSKFWWQDAYNLAMEFKQKFISPLACRAMVAGSIRRGKRMVGDIEIVCIPQYESCDVLKSEATLFDPAVYETVQVNLLAEHLRELVADGQFECIKGLKQDAPRYVKILWRNIKIDIFMCDYDN